MSRLIKINNFSYVCFFAVLIILSGCKKKSSAESADDLDYGPFNFTFSSIQANGKCKINFIQGVENKVISRTRNGPLVTAGLIINGSSGEVTIAIKEAINIQINGNTISSSGPLYLKKVHIQGNGGSAVMSDLHVDSLCTLDVNEGTYLFSGNAKKLSFVMNGAYFQGYNFNSDTCVVLSKTTQPIEINVSKKLKVTTMSSGNVYYKGNPQQIDSSYIGTGRAFPK